MKVLTKRLGPYVLDLIKADEARKFFRNLVHTKGRWAGMSFELLKWQWEEVIKPLFGWIHEETGFRRFRTAYVEVPKKNGKSELAAGIALKLLFADKEQGAEIFSAAADRLQAGIVFNVAKQMVERNSELRSRSRIVDSQKLIEVPKTGSFYRALSAEAYNKHGLNVHGVIFDELHTQPTRELWEVLTLGSGEARTQPLTFAITTAGYDRRSICWEQHLYAEKVRDGVIDDPTFLPVIYGVPVEANWESEKEWIKANPSLGEIITMDGLKKEYEKARHTPALQNTFRRLRLNQWTEAAERFLDLSIWDDCSNPVDPDDLVGRDCYGGLDLASNQDIAAFVLLFSPQEEDDPWQVLCQFWVPEEAIIQRSRKDRVPYDLWSQQGHIEATPGNLIDYSFIYEAIDQAAQRYQVKELAFDRWGSTQIITDLTNKGMNVVQFGQGFASMAPPTKELLKLVLGRKIMHGGNPVLRWMASNLCVKSDPAGNLKPDKSTSSEKIDGMVALIMALGRAMHFGIQGSIYDSQKVEVMG